MNPKRRSSAGSRRLVRALRDWARARRGAPPQPPPPAAEQAPDSQRAASIERRLDQVERRLRAIQTLNLLVLASSARELVALAVQRLPELWK